METLKQITAIPLFGTAIWLAWVYGRLYAADGVDRMVRLLACFLLLAIAGWVLGRWPARRGAAMAAVALIVLSLMLPLSRQKPETVAWQPFTPASFEAARASGKPIFVDFTAAWCLSCQVNERAVLRSAEVEKKLTEGNFTLIKADWTKYDPQITQQLASLDRSGVPTYVIYPANETRNPDVLPELLTKDTVLKAIVRDTAKQ